MIDSEYMAKGAQKLRIIQLIAVDTMTRSSWSHFAINYVLKVHAIVAFNWKIAAILSKRAFNVDINVPTVVV